MPRKRRGRTFRDELARLAASERPLRGEAKLEAALAAFAVGVRRVYAVDAGHGQLLGSLRQDPRVVNLERTNLGTVFVPETVELVTLDLSYLPLADAVPQLGAMGVDLIALVKPQFELRLAAPPDDPAPALDAAVAGIARAGWEVRDAIESPVRGAHGAVEFFVFATRPAGA